MSHKKRVDQTTVTNLNTLETDSIKNHPLEFFLYFSSEWDAYVAKSQLVNLQFFTSVHYSKSSDKWLCLASKKVTPTSDRLTQLQNFLEEFASHNNGKYDGWGTPVFDK